MRPRDSKESREKRRSTGEAKEGVPDAKDDIDSGRLVEPLVSIGVGCWVLRRAKRSLS